MRPGKVDPRLNKLHRIHPSDIKHMVRING